MSKPEVNNQQNIKQLISSGDSKDQSFSKISPAELNDTRKQLEEEKQTMDNVVNLLWAITLGLFVIGGMIGSIGSKFLVFFFELVIPFNFDNFEKEYPNKKYYIFLKRSAVGLAWSQKRNCFSLYFHGGRCLSGSYRALYRFARVRNCQSLSLRTWRRL